MSNSNNFTQDNALCVIDERKIFDKDFRIWGTIENPLFWAKDVAAWIDYAKTGQGYYDVSNMLSTIDNDEKVLRKIFVDGKSKECWLLTEDGVYEVLMQSHKPIAKQFKKKVKEILKTIRKTGGYVSNEEMFIKTYLPYADEETKLIFAQTLRTLRAQNEKIEQQKIEIMHKEDVIIGLVENIDLATKRQRITQIVRYGANGKYQERYNLLYREFERKYHCDLNSRMEHFNKIERSKREPVEAKVKNKMDYIDRGMKMTPELYEIACKIFENDIEKLKAEWESIVA